MKTAKINIRFLLLQCINIILSGCTIYGYAPVGIGYFAALYMQKPWRIATFIATFLGLAYTVPYMQCIKYFVVMMIYMALTGILEHRNHKDILPSYIYGITATISIAVLEVTDWLFTYSNQMQDVATICGVCVLAGALMIVFARGIQGILRSGEGREIQNEEMIGIATICGICMCSLVMRLDIPYSLLETGIYFLLLFFSYKYGAGLGAILGAGFGISMGIQYDNIEMVGIVCVTAIVVGTLGELGRAAAVLSMLCCLAISGFVFAPYFLSEANIQGMLTASIIFLILPSEVIYRLYSDLREKEDYPVEVIPDKMTKAVSEKLHTLSESLDMLYQQFWNSVDTMKVPTGQDYGEYRRMYDIWQGRFSDVKDSMMLQIGEISAMIDNYSEKLQGQEGYDVEKRKKITKRLRSKGVTICEMRQKKTDSGVTELEMTLKCDSGKTITTKEVGSIISDIMGSQFVAEKSDSRVIGSKYRTLNFRQKENFKMSCAVAKSVKGGGKISGDNQSVTEIGNGKWMMTLADGMGSGIAACKESEGVVEFLEKMLTLGFQKESAISLMNSMKSMNWEEEKTTSVDMGVIDMYSGMCNFVKMGAASTFIKRDKWVDVIKSTSLPMGIMKRVDIDSTSKKLYDGDMVVMISDGVADGIREENKELAISRILLDYQENNPKELADRILEKAMEDSYYTPADDMTVVVMTLCENMKSA